MKIRKIKLLLVEDNLPDADLIEANLSMSSLAQYEITTQETLQTGLRSLVDHYYDVVLLDLGLPDSRGIETVVQVLMQAPATPVIVLTGNANLQLGIDAVKQGAQDFLNKSDTDTRTLEKSIYYAIERKLMMVELERLRAREQKLAMQDTLTGLSNRAALISSLDNVIHHAKRTGQLFSVLFIDLDRFKLVNDTEGHLAGDEVLKVVAQRLQELLRKSDFLARIGGDEFIGIVRDFDDPMFVSNVARKINQKVQEPIIINGKEFSVGCSIGIALYPQDASDSDQLIQCADAAMYASKQQGRNQSQYYSECMHLQAEQDYLLEKDIHVAITNGELEVYFQPIIDLDNQSIAACEALLRWTHPKLGTLPPSIFIPIAERSGAIVKLGDYVLREVAKRWRHWKEHCAFDVRVSVNVSVTQFRRDDFVSVLEEILQEVGVDGRWLELEITENAILQKSNVIMAHFERLRQLGIRVSIDDFGTGFSSLSYLRDYTSVSTLKIDKTFVDDIAENINDQVIVKAILALAEQLSLDVIVEGVETEAHYNTLTQLHCQNMQGFYFCKPVPADQFESYSMAYEKRPH